MNISPLIDKIHLDEGVFVLKSGVVAIIQHINESGDVGCFSLYKDVDSYIKKYSGNERKSQSLYTLDDYNELIENFWYYLYHNPSIHDFSEDVMITLCYAEIHDEFLSFFFDFDYDQMKITSINNPVFEKFMTTIDFKCDLAPPDIERFHVLNFNKIWFYGRAMSYNDVVACIRYNGGVDYLLESYPSIYKQC